MQRQTDLWLWPLPDGNTLSLLLQWTSLGVPLIRHRIEMHSVRAAAQREMRYWP